MPFDDDPEGNDRPMISHSGHGGKVTPQLEQAIEVLEQLGDYFQNTEQYYKFEYVESAIRPLSHLKHLEEISK